MYLLQNNIQTKKVRKNCKRIILTSVKTKAEINEIEK